MIQTGFLYIILNFPQLSCAENLNLSLQFLGEPHTIPKFSVIFLHKLLKKRETTPLPAHRLTNNSTYYYYTQKYYARLKNTVPKIKQKMFGLQLETLLMGNWSKLSFHITGKLNFCVYSLRQLSKRKVSSTKM